MYAMEKSPTCVEDYFGDPYRIRTDVKGVRGLCLNHLTNGPLWYTISGRVMKAAGGRFHSDRP